MTTLDRYVKGKKFFESVVEDGSDIIFIVDFNGKIYYHNPSAKNVLGYQRNSLLGKNFFDYINPDALVDLKKRYKASTKKAYSNSVEFQFLCKDNSYKHLEFNSINLKFKEGVEGLILDCRDISQRKKDAEELLRAQKAKELFLANISHEVRTPINGIAGIATLLTNNPTIQDQAIYLNAIKSAADNLKVIINDILDLASIESGKLTFEQIDFSLSDLLHSLEDVFSLQAKEKGLSLQIELGNSANRILAGDPVRLNQILINLVGNAIKFTPTGTIKISTTAKKIGPAKVAVKFEVEDSGIGIPADKLTTIFESFSQADASVTRKYGGTGLGLTIVKQLVELQNGSIEVISKENVGSTFTVIIPYSIGKVSKKVTAAFYSKITKVKTDLKGMKVLLVEDNDINRLYAVSILRNWHCEFDTAENGYAALKKIKASSFDVVLMDIQMPVMDGFETTKEIRQFSNQKNKIPIVALTANATKKAIEKCLAAGMNECLIKPFTPDELFMVLTKYTKQRKITKDSVSKTISKNNIPDLSYLNNVSKGNQHFVTDIINTVLKAMPPIVKEIKKHNAEGKWKLLASAIHKVKPSLTMLGLPELKDEAFQLEEIFSNSHIVETPPSQRVTNLCRNLSESLLHLKKMAK